MISNRRMFLKAASTITVGALLPMSVIASSVSNVPTKYGVVQNMVNDIAIVGSVQEEATRRFGVLLTYMLDNFEPPKDHHIDEAREKLWNQYDMNDVANLQHSMSDGIYPVAVVRAILRNSDLHVTKSDEYNKFASVYRDVILKSHQ